MAGRNGALPVAYQAHRGAVDEAPENTLAAFRHAWRYPGAVPETDVRVTADGVMVCLHDATLARTTDAPPEIAQRPVAELTLAEIRQVDAGIRFGEAWRGARVPTFDELLQEMVRAPGRRLFVEPKAVDLATLRAKLDEYQVVDRVLFVSGYPEMLAEIQRVFPGAPAMTWVGGTPDAIQAGTERWLAAGLPNIQILQLHWPVKLGEPEPVYAIDETFLADTQRRLQVSGVDLQLRPFAVNAAALRRFLRLGICWYVTDGPAAFWRDLSRALRPHSGGEAGYIYHIARVNDWHAALAEGEYRPDSLAREGFIHCSTRAQLLRVANAFFPPASEVVVLCIEPGGLAGVLRYEPPLDSQDPLAQEVFPHVYGALPLVSVEAVADLPAGPDGRFVWPDALP